MEKDKENLPGDFDIYNEENEALLDDDIAPPPVNYFEAFDNALTDIDFSDVTGTDFKKNLRKVNRKIDKKVKVTSPAQRVVKTQKEGKKTINTTRANIKGKKGVQTNIPVRTEADIKGGKKQINKIIVPDNQKVIVQGVSNFILSRSKEAETIKNIGYYEGKRLNKLVLIFNNDSLLNFNLQLFNTSMPLDYLYNTSLNLNDKIQVAGGQVSYSDVLFNLLANPALIINAKFVFSGPNMTAQMNEPLQVINKEITGVQKIIPLNVSLQLDNMQVQGDIVVFDVMKTLNRPFIPDGMDVVNYTVYPGNTITMAFYYKQVSLKKVFYKEARDNKTLL